MPFPLLPHAQLQIIPASLSLFIHILKNSRLLGPISYLFQDTRSEYAFQWQLYVLTSEDCHLGGFKSSSLPRLAGCICKVFPGQVVPPQPGAGWWRVSSFPSSSCSTCPPFHPRPWAGVAGPPRSRRRVPTGSPRVKGLKQIPRAGLLPLQTPDGRDLWQHSWGSAGRRREPITS